MASLANKGPSDFFDNAREFKRIMSQYPTGNRESNFKYLLQYKKGDLEARDMLILTNLRLVFDTATKMLSKAKSLELDDFLQVGVIALMNSIDNFDISRGDVNFSTYALEYIKGYLLRSLDNDDDMIRKPVHIAENRRKIRKLENSNPSLSDEEKCELLNISKNTLESVQKASQLNVSSLNEKVKEDSDSELEIFFSDNGIQNQNTIDLYEKREFLAYLKQKLLTPIEYYVCFYKIFTNPPINEEILASKLGITRQSMYIKSKSYTEKIKKIYNNGVFDYKVANLDLDDILPINPDNIIKYLFFRDTFSLEEKRVFKQIIKKNYLYKETYSKEMNMSLEEFEAIMSAIRKKTEMKDTTVRRKYEMFRVNLLNKYKSEILRIDLDQDLNEISDNFDEVEELWTGLDYSYALSIISKSKIDGSMGELLKSYFNDYARDEIISLKQAEKDINECLYGSKSKTTIPLEELYYVLEQNKSQFSEVQYMYLLMQVFKKVSKDDFKKKFPDSYLSKENDQYLLMRLEKMYFGLINYRDLIFSRDNYLEVRETVMKKISKERANILDMYYGVKTKNNKMYSIPEISEITGYSSTKLPDMLRKARNIAESIYIDSSLTITVNEKIYIPYIIDEDFELDALTREVLKNFLIKKMTYHQLSELHGLSNEKISSTIRDGLRKIDFYRFGIKRSENRYTSEELFEALNSLNITSEERDIIKQVLESESNSRAKVNELYGVRVVDNLMNRLYDKAYSKKLSSVYIDENDIRSAVLEHVSLSVLNVKEKTILALTYGIKCDINPLGIKMSRDEIKIKYPEIGARFKKIFDGALNTIKALKIGLVRPTFGYMRREELQNHLQDKRLPLSSKERELLNYSFELNGYPYKSLNELSSIYGSAIPHIRRSIQIAFTTIFKYENGEIRPKLDYEENIKDNLKYFSKSDQEVLVDKYKEGLTNEKIAKKYGLTKIQVDTLIVNLNVYLNDLLSGKVQGFDYDYFWAHVNDDDVVFSGDKETAIKAFYLYYEKRMSFPKIAEFLELNYNSRYLSFLVNKLMLQVLKKRAGFTQNENEELFDLRKSDRGDIIALLKEYKNQLSPKTINTLLSEFDISMKELMSENEQFKVLKLLASVNDKKVKAQKNIA